MFVIVKLMGGLGNQLFQYAMARRLALQRSAILRLDLSFLEDKLETTDTPRTYGLDLFPALKAVPLRGAEAHQLARTTQLPYRLYNKARKILGLSPAFLYLGEGEFFVVNPIVFAGGPPAQLLHLEGYWQNERYFADIASALRQDLTFPPFSDSRNQAVVQRIEHSTRPTVSVHVRRGDYIKYTAFGMCSMEYYERAMAHVKQHLINPSFFVFSDDIAWVRQNLPFPVGTEFIYWNQGDASYNDMHLMSLCQHHIIANSSFSWWGAWLNPQIDKIVICPQNWMLNPTVPSNQVVPESWVIL